MTQSRPQQVDTAHAAPSPALSVHHMDQTLPRVQIESASEDPSEAPETSPADDLPAADSRPTLPVHGSTWPREPRERTISHSLLERLHLKSPRPGRTSTASSAAATASIASATAESADGSDDAYSTIKSAPAALRATALVAEKTRKRFLRRFPELATQGTCNSTYVCALEKDLRWQGTLFVATTHLCFYGKFFTKSHRVVIPIADIVQVERKATVRVLQNSLKVSTAHFSYLFTNFLHRDAAFNDIMLVLPASRRDGILRASDAPDTDGAFTGGDPAGSAHISEPVGVGSGPTSLDANGTADLPQAPSSTMPVAASRAAMGARRPSTGAVRDSNATPVHDLVASTPVEPPVDAQAAPEIAPGDPVTPPELLARLIQQFSLVCVDAELPVPPADVFWLLCSVQSPVFARLHDPFAHKPSQTSAWQPAGPQLEPGMTREVRFTRGLRLAVFQSVSKAICMQLHRIRHLSRDLCCVETRVRMRNIPLCHSFHCDGMYYIAAANADATTSRLVLLYNIELAMQSRVGQHLVRRVAFEALSRVCQDTLDEFRRIASDPALRLEVFGRRLPDEQISAAKLPLYASLAVPTLTDADFAQTRGDFASISDVMPSLAAPLQDLGSSSAGQSPRSSSPGSGLRDRHEARLKAVAHHVRHRVQKMGSRTSITSSAQSLSASGNGSLQSELPAPSPASVSTPVKVGEPEVPQRRLAVLLRRPRSLVGIAAFAVLVVAVVSFALVQPAAHMLHAARALYRLALVGGDFGASVEQLVLIAQQQPQAARESILGSAAVAPHCQWLQVFSGVPNILSPAHAYERFQVIDPPRQFSARLDHAVGAGISGIFEDFISQ